MSEDPPYPFSSLLVRGELVRPTTVACSGRVGVRTNVEHTTGSPEASSGRARERGPERSACDGSVHGWGFPLPRERVVVSRRWISIGSGLSSGYFLSTLPAQEARSLPGTTSSGIRDAHPGLDSGDGISTVGSSGTGRATPLSRAFSPSALPDSSRLEDGRSPSPPSVRCTRGTAFVERCGDPCRPGRRRRKAGPDLIV